MNILIDDNRNLGADVICRTGEAGVQVITSLASHNIFVDMLLMDHDLGPGIDGKQTLEHILSAGYRPKEVYLVTANPIGEARLAAVCNDYGYTRSPNDPRHFKLPT